MSLDYRIDNCRGMVKVAMATSFVSGGSAVWSVAEFLKGNYDIALPAAIVVLGMGIGSVMCYRDSMRYTSDILSEAARANPPVEAPNSTL